MYVSARDGRPMRIFCKLSAPLTIVGKDRFIESRMAINDVPCFILGFLIQLPQVRFRPILAVGAILAKSQNEMAGSNRSNSSRIQHLCPRIKIFLIGLPNEFFRTLVI